MPGIAEIAATPEEGARLNTVVTSENAKEYYDEQLGVSSQESEDAAEDSTDPEVAAKAKFDRLEAEKAEKAAAEVGPKEGDVEGSKVYFKGKWVGKHDFNYRLHTQTEAKQKEADERVAKAAAEAKADRDAREKAERDAAELRAKYEPPKSLEPAPEPKPENFNDVAEYSKALKAWAKDEAIREREAADSDANAKRQAEQVTKAWNERKAAVTAEIPDFAETIAASEVKVSDQVRDAIVESEEGPKILYHLAKHPEEAERIGKLTIGGALKAIGKLEALVGSSKGEPKGEQPAKEAPKLTVVAPAPAVEISKAPAPITPLRGANSPSGMKLDSNGNWLGTYEEFKAADLAGKFK